MARPRQRTNLVTRLADAGEEAIQRLSEAPGGEKLLAAVNSMRERVDEMQKKVVGLDSIEERLTAIERRLDKLEGKGSAATRKRTSSTSSQHEGSGSTGGNS